MSYCPACKHSDPHNTLRGGHRQCAACLDEWCKAPRKKRKICTDVAMDLAVTRESLAAAWEFHKTALSVWSQREVGYIAEINRLKTENERLSGDVWNTVTAAFLRESDEARRIRELEAKLNEQTKPPRP